MKTTLPLVFVLSVTLSLYAQVPSNWVYDANAVYELNAIRQGDYVIEVNPVAHVAVIRQSDNLRIVHGSYNMKFQFWNRGCHEDVLRKVNPRTFFRRVNLSDAQLTRMAPESETYKNFTQRETGPVSLTADPALETFVGYSRNRGVSEEYLREVLTFAQNPAKRGGLQPYDLSVKALETSFQNAPIKPELYRLVPPRQVPVENLRRTGGIQYYLSIGSGEYRPMVDGGYDLFVQNPEVPLTFVYIKNTATKRSDLSNPRSTAQEIAAAMEETFGKPMALRYREAELDYLRFEAPPNYAVGAHINTVLDNLVTSQYGRDSLYIYYMADAQSFARYDRELSHPYSLGATAANWPRISKTFMHEMGHTLGLYHHFAEVRDARSKEAHISTPCLMNYAFSGEELCALCQYALRVGTNTPSAQTSEEIVIREVPLAQVRTQGSSMTLLLPGGGRPINKNFPNYRFEKAQAVEGAVISFFQWVPTGDWYTGVHEKTLEVRGNAYLGSLTPQEAKLHQGRLLIQYRNNQGTGYVGSFQNSSGDYEFVNETNFGTLQIEDWLVQGDRIYVQYNDGGQTWLGTLNLDGVYLEQTDPRPGINYRIAVLPGGAELVSP
jgi:hypothetical protein